MKRSVLVLAGLALASPGVAAQVDTDVKSACALRGYVNDKDPKGTNLRAGPRVDAPVVGHLPSEQEQARGRGEMEIQRPEFDIVGAKDGWLLIRNVIVNDLERGVVPGPAGPAWISGGLVAFTIGSTELRTTPSTDGPVVAKLVGADADESWGPDSWQVLRVHSCEGHFASVTIRRSGLVSKAPLSGWVGGVCSNQLTTCDRP